MTQSLLFTQRRSECGLKKQQISEVNQIPRRKIRQKKQQNRHAKKHKNQYKTRKLFDQYARAWLEQGCLLAQTREEKCEPGHPQTSEKITQRRCKQYRVQIDQENEPSIPKGNPKEEQVKSLRILSIWQDLPSGSSRSPLTTSPTPTGQLVSYRWSSQVQSSSFKFASIRVLIGYKIFCCCYLGRSRCKLGSDGGLIVNINEYSSRLALINQRWLHRSPRARNDISNSMYTSAECQLIKQFESMETEHTILYAYLKSMLYQCFLLPNAFITAQNHTYQEPIYLS